MAPQGSELWYMVFPIIVLGIALLHYRKPKTGLLLLFILLFFSMFRGDHVGNDTLNYLDENQISYSAANLNDGIGADNLIDNFGKKIEFGAILLNYIVYNFDLPPRLIIFTYSIIAIVFLFLALKRLRINTSLGLLFFVLLSHYFLSFNFARQYCAIGLFIFGVTYLFRDDKSKCLFFIYTLLAAFFHISALFFSWMYLLRYVKVSRSLLLVLMSIVCLFTIFSSYNIMDYIYRLFNIEYVTRYMGEFDDSDRSLLGRLNDCIVYGFMLFLFYIRKGNRLCDLYDILFALSIVLMALMGHSSWLVSRITFYSTAFCCFYIPKVVLEKKALANNHFLVFFSIYCVVIVYGFRTMADAMTSGYYLMF